jgi:hypothetical protein
MRLASFIIASENAPPVLFIGVPITACGGGVLASFVLVLFFLR